MLANPGPWFVSPGNDLTVVSLLPPGGTARHPSQYPLKTLRGYPVASRFSDEVSARQVCLFPDLVRLVDVILHLGEVRQKHPGKFPEDDHGLLVEQMDQLVEIAGRCRAYLGTSGERPEEVKVALNKWETGLPPFSRPHLERLQEVGLADQVALFKYWQDHVDPMRGMIL